MGGRDTEKCHVYLYPVSFLVTSVHSVTKSTLAKRGRLPALAQHATSPAGGSPSCESLHGKLPGPRPPLHTCMLSFLLTFKFSKRCGKIPKTYHLSAKHRARAARRHRARARGAHAIIPLQNSVDLETLKLSGRETSTPCCSFSQPRYPAPTLRPSGCDNTGDPM